MTEAARAAEGPAPPGVERFRERLRSGLRTEHDYVLLLGLRTFDTPGLVKRTNEGFSFHAWERFGRATALPVDELQRIVQISSRTLSRRKREGRLRSDESDRLLRVTRVFAAVLALFEGDVALARGWFSGPQPGLGGARPLDYAATEVGAREVEDLVGRLEYRIPS